MMHRFHAGRPESRSSVCGEKDAILRMDYLKRRTRTGIRSSRRSICSRGRVVYDIRYDSESTWNPHGGSARGALASVIVALVDVFSDHKVYTDVVDVGGGGRLVCSQESYFSSSQHRQVIPPDVSA